MSDFKEIKAKYINPYTDFGFKRLFGVEANKDLLIDFLNQMLPAKHQIKSLVFKNTENIPELSEDRKAIFDIHCESITGKRFIVEMQKAKIKYLKDRAVYYVTFPIIEQAGKGDWNFKLNPIYYITLLDFYYEPHSKKKKQIPKFRRDVMLIDQYGKVFYNKLRFTFMQMPAFDKTEDQLETHYDKWCYFLKHLEEFNDIPTIFNEPVFQQAFKTAEIANLSKDEYKKYLDSLDAYREIKGITENAIEEGWNNALVETAKKLIRKGHTNETIKDGTDLSDNQIDELRKQLENE